MAGCVDADVRADKDVITYSDFCFVENGQIEICKKAFAYIDIAAVVSTKRLIDLKPVATTSQ